jgi:nitroreductase
MNASNAFRSHLMQQFVAAARTQSRPPLALLGIASDEDSRIHPSAASTGRQTPPLVRRYSNDSRRSSSLSDKMISFPPTSPIRSSTSSLYRTASVSVDQQSRLLSGTAVDEEEQTTSLDMSSTTLSLKYNPVVFQNLLQTRRSCSRFASRQEDIFARDKSYWKDALDRAVTCGLTAPNHKRTEPFRFKRMLSPSQSTTRLAEIAYQVTLRRTATTAEDAEREEEAARKRDKWSKIPAFLVTMVESSQDLSAVSSSEASAAGSAYDRLPFVPPQTERELEDYAAACAAVQNILLSLHAEHIASKWVTGSVIQTAAFRELVQADPHYRVVALIMLGEPHETAPHIQRRRQRRQLHRPLEVALEDLE